MQDTEEFEAFVGAVEPSLRRALIAAYGRERGREATAEALAWAWEHWSECQKFSNAVAYLYRVGQSRTRPRRFRMDTNRSVGGEVWAEPGLVSALGALTEHQRVAVVLVHGFGWQLREVAELLGVKVTTVQNHVERGVQRLRTALKVESDA